MTSIRDILIARHAANVRKANPWPTTSGAVTTRKVGGYPSGSKTAEQMKPPPANITHKEGAKLTTEVESLKATIEQMGKVAADTIDLLTKERNEALTTMARDERAGVASETEPLAGTTGVAEAHRIAVRDWREGMDARASVARLTRINEVIMATSDDERAAASKALRDAAHKVAALTQELADIRIRLAERDAQVVALTKRLSEGQG